jgi:antitoxin component YwqK of YwqJK toxin-antitoxin module
MKTNALLLITILSLLFACNSSELSKRELSERLRKIVLEEGITEKNVYSYSYKFGEVDSSSKYLFARIIYDEQGNIKKEIVYSDNTVDGPAPDTTYYFYDDNNSITSINRISYDISNESSRPDTDLIDTAVITTEVDTTILDSTLTRLKSEIKYYPAAYYPLNDLNYNLYTRKEVKEVYKYDERLNAISMKTYIDGVLKNIFSYTYNDNNQLTKEIKYHPDNSILQKTEYTFLNNILVGSKSFSSDGIIRESFVLKLIDKNLKEYSYYDSEGKLVRTETVKTDGIDELEIVLELKEEDSILKISREFYKKGVLKSITNFKDGEPIRYVLSIPTR